MLSESRNAQHNYSLYVSNLIDCSLTLEVFRVSLDELVYDWNTIDPALVLPNRHIGFDDETLRDGLQSPSVSEPPVEQKIELLHLMDALGIDTADIGLPGAGGTHAAGVELMAREIAEQETEDPAQLRRAHASQRHPADRRNLAARWHSDRSLHVHRLLRDSFFCGRLDARQIAETDGRSRDVCGR